MVSTVELRKTVPFTNNTLGSLSWNNGSPFWNISFKNFKLKYTFVCCHN